MSNYWAHTHNAEGKPHLLQDHLQGVAALAERFAVEMNLQLGEPARWAGLFHDLGKYRSKFQSYLRGECEGSDETHHAIYGAALTFKIKSLGPTLAIAGHHAGLHDWTELRQALRSDERYHTAERLPSILERASAEIGPMPDSIREPDFIRNQLSLELYVRLLFSSVVDADFLDTEAHHKLDTRAVVPLDAEALLARVVSEKASKSSEGRVNELRNKVFNECLLSAQSEPGFYSLTVPTGGGKTLAAMAFALSHAQIHRLRRIIVVIPYLSIIEQNAAAYKRILDPDRLGVVVEDHSGIPPSDDSGEARPRSPLSKHAAEYAAENWDAPIIVTTSVQFIESLFANRTSRCRKLHNIARSVVIFDEVQTLPAELLNPMLNVFRELREKYGVTFVFCTATQPAFQHSPHHLSEGFEKGEVQEITSETGEYFRDLQRVEYSLPTPDVKTTWDELSVKLAGSSQALCVVNLRRHASDLWEKLCTSLPPSDRDGLFHLSSAMCAQHRLDLLGKYEEPAPGTIRYRLLNDLPCRLISTQLIEAGVDVDFPIVYRALGPLDSIVQAAGRCNREGRLMGTDGKQIRGRVIVFIPEDATLPPGIYKRATEITAPLLRGISAADLAQNHHLFPDYFKQLYQMSDSDKAGIQSERACLNYRKVAARARVISSETKPVIVLYARGAEIVDEIRARRPTKGESRFSRQDFRSLQRYIVSVYPHEFNALKGLGHVSQLLPNLELYVLSPGLYHRDLGLIISQRPLEDLNL